MVGTKPIRPRFLSCCAGWLPSHRAWDLGLSCGLPFAVVTRYSTNSSLPAGPRIGDGETPITGSPALPPPACSAIDCSCSALSRTTPPLPTWPFSTSNCGFDEGQNRTFRGDKLHHRRQKQRLRDKRRIAGCQVGHIGKLLGQKMPRVLPVEHGHSRVLLELVGSWP